MNNKTYRKDVSDAELETLQEGAMETLMCNVIPRRNTHPTPAKEEESESSAQEGINKVCVENKEYLESIFQFPFLTITGRADHQGLSPYMNDKIKKDLLNKGLIEEFSANLGHTTKGNVKFIVLTKSGYRVIGKSAPKEKELTCSLEHWFYQQAGHAFYLAKGYRSIIEW
ncbi:MAG: hypothetical protein F3745_09245, partial [Nitrospinae bacterium]|nr:hypothetical protein [Nitrospinota bacterium]